MLMARSPIFFYPPFSLSQDTRAFSKPPMQKPNIQHLYLLITKGKQTIKDEQYNNMSKVSVNPRLKRKKVQGQINPDDF